jgi:hypothetical protein
MGSAQLKRTRGVERSATILVGASALLSLVPLALRPTVSDDAQAFLDDEISRQQFLDRVAPYSLSSLLPSLANIAAVVLVIMWMYRVSSNHRALRGDLTWGPGWAIGGWFTPPLIYVIPFLTLREMWKASDPDVPIGGDWRAGRASPLITAWFVVYSLIGTALSLAALGAGFGSLASTERALAEQLVDDATLPLLNAAATLAAALLFVLLVTQLGDRHRRLTGEASA